VRDKLTTVDLELRTVRDDEMRDFLHAVAIGFGTTTPPEHDDYPTHLLTAARSLAVCDGDAIVATAGAHDFRLTVPGGHQVPVAGVTDVTVHPTHRRRGLLRRMMAAQLDEVAARGEPLAALTASEASIYRRFGYGMATFTTRFELTAEYAKLDPPVSFGKVTLVDGATAEAAASGVFARIAPARVGEIARPDAWWPPVFAPGRRGPRHFTAVHHDSTGRPDGFTRYAVDQRWPDAIPSSELRVLELQATDGDAEAALWSYLFGIDLVATVTADDRPVDDPLRWRLVDPRRLRVRQVRDHLWLRIVDVAEALRSRTYSLDDTIVLELVDEFRPANSGRWLLDGGPAGATCERTDRAADLAVGAADLGAIYLGGVPISTLVAAGHVRELSTGAARRADRFFVEHPSPWCTTHF
jgi:predicted acetyltransferase